MKSVLFFEVGYLSTAEVLITARRDESKILFEIEFLQRSELDLWKQDY